MPTGVYVISVAARLLDMHPQTLRKYERAGFITPDRTLGMLRLYSEEEIRRLRHIKYLIEEMDLNLAGVDLVLRLAEKLRDVREGVVEGALKSTALAKALDETLEILGVPEPQE